MHSVSDVKKKLSTNFIFITGVIWQTHLANLMFEINSKPHKMRANQLTPFLQVFSAGGPGLGAFFTAPRERHLEESDRLPWQAFDLFVGRSLSKMTLIFYLPQNNGLSQANAMTYKRREAVKS